MDKNNEQELINLVTKWTDHFKCRKDFRRWREKRIWQENYQQDTTKFLERVIPNLKHKKILDLGCGMGGLLIALRRKGFNVTGLDFNIDYCEITKLRGKRYNLDIEVINAKAEKIPIEDHSFDLIICKDVLEHVQSPKELLRESKRILKQNGQLLISVTNRFSYVDPHYHIRFIDWFPIKIGDFILRKASKKDISNFQDNQALSQMHYYTIKSFEKLVRKINFASYFNLTERKINNKHEWYFKTPFLKSMIINFYLSSWNYILTK